MDFSKLLIWEINNKVLASIRVGIKFFELFFCTYINQGVWCSTRTVFLQISEQFFFGFSLAFQGKGRISFNFAFLIGKQAGEVTIGRELDRFCLHSKSSARARGGCVKTNLRLLQKSKKGHKQKVDTSNHRCKMTWRAPVRADGFADVFNQVGCWLKECCWSQSAERGFC